MSQDAVAGGACAPRMRLLVCQCTGLAPPKILEPSRRQLRIANRVLNIPVAQVGLQRPRVVSPVGQGVAASMSQHMRVSLETQFRLDTGTLNHPCKTGR